VALQRELVFGQHAYFHDDEFYGHCDDENCEHPHVDS